MAIHKSVNEELTKLRKQKRELAKKERELKQERAIEKNMDKWQTIMEAKVACKNLLNTYKLGNRWNLTRLDNFPEYYKLYLSTPN